MTNFNEWSNQFTFCCACCVFFCATAFHVQFILGITKPHKEITKSAICIMSSLDTAAIRANIIANMASKMKNKGTVDHGSASYVSAFDNDTIVVKKNHVNHEKRIRANQIRNQINERLEETGERNKLKELLRARLIESGWRDQLKIKCKEIIENKGLEKITVSQLVEEITPYARSTVPENIKSQLLSELRSFITNELK